MRAGPRHRGPARFGRLPPAPAWRNGRRRGLKIPRPQGHLGSSPRAGTNFLSSSSVILTARRQRLAATMPPRSRTLARLAPCRCPPLLRRRHASARCAGCRPTPAGTPEVAAGLAGRFPSRSRRSSCFDGRTRTARCPTVGTAPWIQDGRFRPNDHERRASFTRPASPAAGAPSKRPSEVRRCPTVAGSFRRLLLVDARGLAHVVVGLVRHRRAHDRHGLSACTNGDPTRRFSVVRPYRRRPASASRGTRRPRGLATAAPPRCAGRPRRLRRVGGTHADGLPRAGVRRHDAPLAVHARERAVLDRRASRVGASPTGPSTSSSAARGDIPIRTACCESALHLTRCVSRVLLPPAGRRAGGMAPHRMAGRTHRRIDGRGRRSAGARRMRRLAVTSRRAWSARGWPTRERGCGPSRRLSCTAYVLTVARAAGDWRQTAWRPSRWVD